MNNHPPTQPRNGRKVSQRGLLSIAMLWISISALVIAGLGGTKMVLDVLRDSRDGGSELAQIVVVALAFLVGWFTAMVAIRVYGNLILPLVINWFTWACLAGVCILYIEILKRLYAQPDDPIKYFKYMLMIGGGLVGLVGLHLIVEDHDLRPFAVPLLIISLSQLGMIVFRYVFDTNGVKTYFLWKDLLFFFAMITVSVAMLAHWGILEPFRHQITHYFDHNSKAIRTQD